MSIYNHIFDQFQRYFTVSKIISKLRCSDKIKVLEVGANAHSNLLSYLPDADITLSDLYDQPVKAGVKFVQADATNLPFEDNEFDFVISLDVIEHVPSMLREQFISECTRVAKTAFVLACPVDFEGATKYAEKSANDLFEYFHDVPHPWLIEHADEGLPTANSINLILGKNQVKFERFECAQLELWELLTKMHFMETVDQRYHQICQALYTHYNKFLYQKDHGDKCYRSFWVIGDNVSIDKEMLFPQYPTEEDISLYQLLSEYFSILENLSSDIKTLRYEIQTLRTELVEKNNEIISFQTENDQLKKFNRYLEDTLNSIINSLSMKITMPLRLGNRLLSGDWNSIRQGLEHRFPAQISLCSYLFNPAGGGVIQRIKRSALFMLKHGPKACFRHIQRTLNAGQDIENLGVLYDRWVEKEEHCISVSSEPMIQVINESGSAPLISVLVPVYNTDEQYLRKCIESVINQSYSNWELCIADDASTLPHIREVLSEYQAKDDRINVVYRELNGHISIASNSALEIATGNWLALLDHDDELHTHALLYVASEITKNKNVEFIYTDEDKIDEIGKRANPNFKPDWNLDLLYSQNYVSHLGIYKTEVVKKIGGFRAGFEGSQDYDLLLRYSREINSDNIIHIAKVLYHWRTIPGSTALNSDEKSYTSDAGVKALNDHFKCLNKKVKIQSGLVNNTYKVNWPTFVHNCHEPLVSLVIPTYNGYEITKQAIDSILNKTKYSNFEILLVDNNSDDEKSLNYFKSLEYNERVRVLRYPFPFNYSSINNFAVKHAKGEIIGLINNDVEVISNEWLTEMVSHCLREDIGCVGAKLYYPNDTIQHAGIILGIGGVAGHSHKYFPRHNHGYFSRLKVVQNLSAVTAACLLVRKSVFEQVNGLNENDLTVAFNDVDFCLKVQKAGYRNIWTPYAELYHHESISRGAEDNPEKIARFNKEVDYMKETWSDILTKDPAYNMNLTLVHENFSLKSF